MLRHPTHEHISISIYLYLYLSIYIYLSIYLYIYIYTVPSTGGTGLFRHPTHDRSCAPHFIVPHSTARPPLAALSKSRARHCETRRLARCNVARRVLNSAPTRPASDIWRRSRASAEAWSSRSMAVRWTRHRVECVCVYIYVYITYLYLYVYIS